MDVGQINNKRFNLRISEELLKGLNDEAVRQNRPISNLVKTILIEFLEKNKK
ncbi:MAG: CopG family transcriptional regulator [Bacteroidetes bacterium]|nr:CopG family transcriptional regulator [Bacteroidota bacterium]